MSKTYTISSQPLEGKPAGTNNNGDDDDDDDGDSTVADGHFDNNDDDDSYVHRKLTFMTMMVVT